MYSELKDKSTRQNQAPVQRHASHTGKTLEDNRDHAPVQRQPNRTGLPDNLKSGMESLSGMSLDHVKVHYNSPKPAAVQAHAYAQGSDIHLASGQEKHLPHELGHVVQQAQGRVQPTTSVGGMAVNDSQSLENEATALGNKALQMKEKDNRSPALTILDNQRKSNENQRRALIGNRSITIIQRELKSKITQNFEQNHVVQQQGKAAKTSTPKLSSHTGHDAQNNTFVRQLAGPKKGNDRDDNNKIKRKKNIFTWLMKKFSPNSVEKVSVSYKLEEKDIEEDERNVSGSYKLEEKDIEEDKGGWGKWNKYINFAIGECIELDKAADVKKNKNYQSEKSDDYIKKFKIVTKKEFNTKLWEMADELCRLDNYTCVISEAGKSNFWVTARVLKRVRHLGGNAPTRLIQVPTQEKSMKTRIELEKGLEGAGTIVFIDDGAFSGSQMSELINKVLDGADNDVKVGLVAVSEKAKGAMEIGYPNTERKNPQRQLLIEPLNIEEYKNRKAQDKYTQDYEFNKKQMTNQSHENGNHLLGFYYKIPDFASVRNKILTTKNKDDEAPIIGYKNEKGESKTEPYKKIAEENLQSLKLESVVESKKESLIKPGESKNNTTKSTMYEVPIV